MIVLIHIPLDGCLNLCKLWQSDRNEKKMPASFVLEIFKTAAKKTDSLLQYQLKTRSKELHNKFKQSPGTLEWDAVIVGAKFSLYFVKISSDAGLTDPYLFSLRLHDLIRQKKILH